ncbi:MAG: peptide-methionine (S)-S-oxide reductase [Anaerolineales bacterium]
MGKQAEIATLAGGCFWCLEAVFDELKGVETVESGYSGGHVQSPSYAQVCNGDTGFTAHDPTTLNRQGNDVGTQYRSAIFYHNEEQKEIAEGVIQEIGAEKIWDDPIVTEVKPFDQFYIAEDYHQEYFQNNSFQPYCRIVIAPKVARIRRKFADRLKK